MRIHKQLITSLDQPYSVSPFVYQGKPCCLAASEGEGGECKLLTDQAVITLRGALEGGCMNLVPVPEMPDTFLTIQRFYPIFRSEQAKIVMVHVNAPNADQTADCEVTELCELPFVHRIGLIGQVGQRYLAAGVLCRSKAFTDDWSQPGYVAAFPFDPTAGRVGAMEMILPEMHKNHGMAVTPQSGSYEMLVSGAQGVFSVGYEAGEWHAENLLPLETSDVCMIDIDGDGLDEMLTIQGFHGNAFNGYHQTEGGAWEQAFSRPLAFGHVLWCGYVQGKACALSGSRSDRRELTLHVFEHGSIAAETVLDAPCAPTQVAVNVDENGARVYASNTFGGEITLYTITEL